jgi:hypothetical protein
LEIFCENVWWNRGSTGCDFCQFIGGLIIPACNVVELKAVKLVLEALHLLAVGFHLGVTAAQALHDLIDHELGVALNIKVSDPELDGNS